MITPSDVDYQKTKQIKRNGKSLESPFSELADWFESEYKVPVLNMHYDTVIPDDRPRLNLIFEKENDALKFRNGPLGNFNKIDQKCVAEQFCSILERHSKHQMKTKDLFVIFTAFETVARIEANESVSEKEICKLKRDLDNGNLWKISRLFDSVTFFFYTYDQAKKAVERGLLDKYSHAYSKLVAKYDEFGYHENRPVSAHFDSKENFDTNFQSNWYYYYK